MNDMSFLESRQENPTFMTGISAFHPGYTALLSFPTMQKYE